MLATITNGNVKSAGLSNAKAPEIKTYEIEDTSTTENITPVIESGVHQVPGDNSYDNQYPYNMLSESLW